MTQTTPAPDGATAATRPITLGDLLEAMADVVGDRPAVRTIDRDWSFREIDERSTRLANHLVSIGVRPGEHVAVHSPNRIEWVDAFYGCLKARAVPINVNHKYLHDELAHVYGDAGCVATIVAPEYVDLVHGLDLPSLREVIVLDEGYDAALAAASTTRLTGRCADDRYLLYTGGTTGRPKGVVWRQEDLMRAALNQSRFGAPFDTIEQLADEAAANENPLVLLACGPMMHGGSQWILGNAHMAGAAVGLFTEPNFSARGILDLVEKARVNSLTFLGDAMGRPVAEAILAEPDRWDLSSLVAVSNGAAPLSEGVREEIRRALPGRFILDSYGASESGATGARVDDGTSPGDLAPRFDVSDQVEVFDAELTPCPPGVTGLLGRSGPVPLGYHNDPEGSAATFREIDGVRWAIPGDLARREEDGTVTVLGRGSQCINTGGEKVHPEEVEAVLVRHPDVFDAAVVGTPHERWGQQVTALVQRRGPSSVSEDELREHCRSLISNYKVPKVVLFVDEVPRTAVSKVDYRAAARVATERLS